MATMATHVMCVPLLPPPPEGHPTSLGKKEAGAGGAEYSGYTGGKALMSTGADIGHG